MNYQEITNIWNDTSESIDRDISVRQELLQNVSIQNIKTNLYEIKWTSFFELIVNSFWIVFLIRFITIHIDHIGFIIPASILILIALFSLAIETRKLIHYFTLSPSSSVFQTQKKLTKLQLLEHIDTLSLYFIIPLFAAPFFLILGKEFFSVNLYQYSNALIFISFGSVIIALILVYILKKFPNKALRESVLFLSELKNIQ